MEFINQAGEVFGPVGVAWITDHFIPALEQVYGLIAVLTVGLALVGFGAVVVGRHRVRSADLVCGWGVVGLVLTLMGVFTQVPFVHVTVALGFLSIPAIVFIAFRDDHVLVAGTGRILTLTAPLFLLAAAMTASQWAEFSQWLMMERFIWDQDAFPRLGLPKLLAEDPAHPYGVPLMTYPASRLAGFFVENAGPLFNLLLLFSFALAVMELIRRAAGRAGDGVPGWGMAALGILVVTVFNPTFTPRVLLTTNTDLPAAVAVAFAALAGWSMLAGLAQDRQQGRARTGQAWQGALQMGLVLAALVGAQRTAPVLSVLLVAGVFLAGLRDPRVGLWRLAALLPLIVVPPAVMYGVWGFHVAEALPGGVYGLRWFETWNAQGIPIIAAGLARVMLAHGAYFILALIIVAFGFKALFRFAGDLDRLAIIAATVIGGYNAYLFYTYVAVFSGGDAATAASYWRGNTQLGLLAVAFGAYGGALLWRRYLFSRLRTVPAAIAVTLVIALPVIFADKLRFDLSPPNQFVRSIGEELAASLPPDSRLMVIDPQETGLYAKMMGYLLYGTAQMAGEVNLLHGFGADGVRRQIQKYKPTHIWVRTRNGAVAAALNLKLEERTAYLLRRGGQGWEVAQSWAYPGAGPPADDPG